MAVNSNDDAVSVVDIASAAVTPFPIRLTRDSSAADSKASCPADVKTERSPGKVSPMSIRLPVGAPVGTAVGVAVGVAVGTNVGDAVGAVGPTVGEVVGTDDGDIVGFVDGSAVGATVVGDIDGVADGTNVGDAVVGAEVPHAAADTRTVYPPETLHAHEYCRDPEVITGRPDEILSVQEVDGV